jgi:hypothetical protein
METTTVASTETATMVATMETTTATTTENMYTKLTDIECLDLRASINLLSDFLFF